MQLQISPQRSIFTLLPIILCFVFPTDWKLEKDKNGVLVYTRTVEGTKLKEFKGVVHISTSIDKLISVLKTVDQFPNWMHNTKGCKIVKTVSEQEFIAYAVNTAPWPVSNRDNVTRYKIIRSSPKLAVITMDAAPNEYPEQDGNIRIKKMKGEWRFEDLGFGIVRVTEIALADPGGNIPAWLSNSAVVDSPYNTLLALKSWIDSGH